MSKIPTILLLFSLPLMTDVPLDKQLTVDYKYSAIGTVKP